MTRAQTKTYIQIRTQTITYIYAHRQRLTYEYTYRQRLTYKYAHTLSTEFMIRTHIHMNMMWESALYVMLVLMCPGNCLNDTMDTALTGRQVADNGIKTSVTPNKALLVFGSGRIIH